MTRLGTADTANRAAWTVGGLLSRCSGSLSRCEAALACPEAESRRPNGTAEAEWEGLGADVKPFGRFLLSITADFRYVGLL